MDLVVCKEFRDLIPPLQASEYQQLRENILRDGCTTPLDVWRRNGEPVIVDGHNRYKICKEHNVHFEVREVRFDGDDSARIWIIQNQFGRRNLTNFQRAELALVLEPLIAAKAMENKSANGGDKKSECENSHTPIEKMRTDESLAQIAGISSNTIRRAKVIKEQGTPEQIERARKGGTGNTVNAIYTEIRHDGITEKICPMCGKTLPIDRFYGEGATCKTCTERRKQILLSGGSVSYEIQTGTGGKKSTNPEGYSKKMREENEIISKVVREMYDANRVVAHTVDHLLEDLDCLIKDFIKKINTSLEIFSGTLNDDGAREKVCAVLKDLEDEIKEIGGRVQ